MNLVAPMETVLTRPSMPTEMAELSLTLPTWQMRELADTADAHGMTVGEFMRGFIQQILTPFPKNPAFRFDSSENAF
jgi:hypothetical protein